MSDRPRVLVLLKTLAVGGAEMLALQSARLWNRTTFDYRLGYLGGSEELEQSFTSEGITTVRFQKNANDPRAALSLARYLQNNQINLVHAHLAQPALLAHYARRGTRARLVATNHCNEASMRPATRWMARAAWPRADAVIAVGQSVANETKSPNCRVIENGVEAARFADAAPADLGIPSDATVVLVLANLLDVKRPLESLRVFERAATDSNSHLVFAGDGPLRNALEAARSQSPLRERIHILGRRTDVPALVRRADVAMLLSRSEGLPLSLLEAAAGETALLATGVASVESLVRHEETGMLAANDDEAVAHLKAMLSDAALRIRLAQSARALVASKFSLETNVRMTEALYRELLAGGAA